MTQAKTDKKRPKEAGEKRKDRAAEIANTFEWLITAFMLAFVFRAFVMEAFRIPTGSMADTLKGAHFQLGCPQCGYEYAYNYGEELVPSNEVSIKSDSPRCPSCGYFLPRGTKRMPANGDRILVLKCIYQFFKPKRWDVVVFKNPGQPGQNFIKRLVARPGEEIQIIDGDVYINGKIARKPHKIQQELWLPIYDNDYQPIRPDFGNFNGKTWQQPFKNTEGSKWDLNSENPTVFELESNADDIHVMYYDTTQGNNFGAKNCAYNPTSLYRGSSYCSDLMVRFYANFNKLDGVVGIGLSKYRRRYKAQVDTEGIMKIAKSDNEAKWQDLTEKKISIPVINKPTLVKFVNVDHQLIFQFGDDILTYDLGLEPDAAGNVNGNIEPEVRIFGSGKKELSHVAIFRDIYYTAPPQDSGEPSFASKGRAFKLKSNEYFVLGDNSPASHDSRRWSNMGIGINGKLAYRAGTVPHDYLVGKAVFVYWPSGYEFPWPQSLKTFLLRKRFNNRLSAIMYWAVTLRWIPNIGQMRFIYGGTSKNS
ncbi:MAG: signal peptidase I [Planctomycetota bacterium]|jgi:signal peptidase I